MRQNAILQRKKKCYLKEINLQTIQKRTCKAFCLQSKNIQYMCATHTYLIFFFSGKFLFSQKEKQSQIGPDLIYNSTILQATIGPYFLKFTLHLQPMPANLQCQQTFNQCQQTIVKNHSSNADLIKLSIKFVHKVMITLNIVGY